jgi:hypothetical protein
MNVRRARPAHDPANPHKFVGHGTPTRCVYVDAMASRVDDGIGERVCSRV